VDPQGFQVAQFIAQAQFMVRLKLITMTGPADTLKVIAVVRIASLQSSDEPRRHNVIHMTAYSSLLEVHCARLHFALPAQR